jgi:dihydroorotase-like cyclic amidohydrolase
MDLLIKNAEVFDGEREEARKTCVLVRGDTIAEADAADGWQGEVSKRLNGRRCPVRAILGS